MNILEQVIGPYGALVLALAALVWVTRQWRAEVRTLREQLLAEKTARLEDARKSTTALLELQQQGHQIAQKAWEVLRQGTLRPPPPE